VQTAENHVTQLTWYQRLWLRIVNAISPYLVSPVGRPTKWRIITAAGANRLRRPIVFNRYPRQIIGIGIRLPDMEIMGERTYHPYLSIVWAKPHGAGRWYR
jgi:hypothetical protein